MTWKTVENTQSSQLKIITNQQSVWTWFWFYCSFQARTGRGAEGGHHVLFARVDESEESRV